MENNLNQPFDFEHAKNFFSAAKAVFPPLHDDPLDEWRVFFSDWERLTPGSVVTREKPLLNCEELMLFAQAFNRSHEEYLRSGVSVNVWRAAGLGHDELRNSQVLSWILDRFGDHGQGSAILEAVVQHLSGLADKQVVGITTDMVRNNNYWTQTESLPLGDIESRVDIEIESPSFLIFIEVKVRAPETGDQLERYAQLAPKKAAGRPWTIIYLTPDGRKPDNVDLHSKVVSFSWKKVANILDTYTSRNLADSFLGRIFSQFADHARHLA